MGKKKSIMEKFVTVSTRLPLKARLVLCLSILIVIVELFSSLISDGSSSGLSFGSAFAVPKVLKQLSLVGKIRERKHINDSSENLSFEQQKKTIFENQIEATEFGLINVKKKLNAIMHKEKNATNPQGSNILKQAVVSQYNSKVVHNVDIGSEKVHNSSTNYYKLVSSIGSQSSV